MARTKSELRFKTYSDFPAQGSESQLYIATDTNLLYRWNGSAYVLVGGGGSGTVNTDASLQGDGSVGDPLGINHAYENTYTTGQVFNDPDVTYTPQAPASSSITFVPDASGFFANGTNYQWYIYSYHFDGTSYAYDSIGIFTTATDPNDGLNYNLEGSWGLATDANGYLIYDFFTGNWLDVGNVTTYTVTPSTSWNIGGFPSLSPNSIVDAGHPVWANKTQDWGTTDFNVMAMGLSGSNHLQWRWKFNGGTGAGALRFESDDGALRTINANIYADTIYAASSISGYMYPSSMGQYYIGYQSSGGFLTGSSNFIFNPSTTRMLLSNSGITPQNQLHMHYSTATAVNIQFTNSSTGSTSSDGTTVGITTGGTFEINQKENLPINIYTLGTLRAQYAASASPRYTVFGGIEAQYNALGSTSTDGVLIDNLTSATSGVPIQRAGRLHFLSNVWDTGASATRVDDWIEEPVLTSGNPATSVLAWARQYNAGGYTYHMNLSSSGRLSIGNGNTVGSANLHVTSTSAEIARIQRTTANNAAFGYVNSSGSMFVGLVSGGTEMSIGSTADVTSDWRFKVSNAGLVSVYDGGNIALGTTTGTKIGTATTQKLAFWNATPIVQPTTAFAAATFVAGAGTAVNDASTFDGYTLKQVVKALRSIGLLA